MLLDNVDGERDMVKDRVKDISKPFVSEDSSDMVQDIGKVQKLVVDVKSLSRVNLLR